MAFYEYGEQSQAAEEATREYLNGEARQAREDAFLEADRCGLLDDEDEATLRRIAYGLAEDVKKRNGAWPTREMAALRRAWDALCLLDDEASAADTAACRDVFAEDEAR